MGQCYSIYLKVKVKDIDGATAALRNYIEREKASRTRFNEDRMKAQGVDASTFDGMLQLVFAGWDFNNYETEPIVGGRLDGGTYITNDFECCYGWEAVMMYAFDEIAPYLEDGSNLKIYPDSGVIKLTVRGGKVI